MQLQHEQKSGHVIFENELREGLQFMLAFPFRCFSVVFLVSICIFHFCLFSDIPLILFSSLATGKKAVGE